MARADVAPRVGLSTASVYPATCATAFELAARLGYDGIEVMVWTDEVSQSAGALTALAEHYGIPILAIHAPTLLITQRVWGAEPWVKVDRSIDLAREVGADTVVLHPPFRWQREYAEEFADGVALREDDSGVTLAVENMFPWRARGREVQAYLPHWDPVSLPYDSVTLDLSHTAVSRSDAVEFAYDLGDRLAHLHLADGSDALQMAHTLGPRLRHIHLADGLGSAKDEHLVPGRGGQPCAEVLTLLQEVDFDGHVVVEVGTRKRNPDEREADLAEALAFARIHLGAAD